jgi:hypothetical protein
MRNYDMMIDMSKILRIAKDEPRLPYSSGIGCKVDT